MSQIKTIYKALLAAFTGLIFMIVLGDYFGLADFWRVGIFLLSTFSWFGILVERDVEWDQ